MTFVVTASGVILVGSRYGIIDIVLKMKMGSIAISPTLIQSVAYISWLMERVRKIRFINSLVDDELRAGEIRDAN
jgi:hypothetical protein